MSQSSIPCRFDESTAAFLKAEAARDEASRTIDELKAAETTAQRERASIAARLDGLKLGLERKDASAALLAAGDSIGGLLGSVAALIGVRAGYETAVSAALGSASEAVAVAGLDVAVSAIDKGTRQRHALVMSDGVGGVVITRTGANRAPAALSLPGNAAWNASGKTAASLSALR